MARFFEHIGDVLKTRRYKCNDVLYTGIKNYPKFALAFSSEKRKYSLYSVEDGTATDFFLDEIITSDEPLESWVRNYIVGRIGDSYYIVNSLGDCFCKSKKKYAACRNVFVSMHLGESYYDCFFFVVNKNLEIVYRKEGDIKNIEGVAMLDYNSRKGWYRLITEDGEIAKLVDASDYEIKDLAGFIVGFN